VSPLLSVLLEDKEDQYDKVSVEVIEVAVITHLLGTMINSAPKQIEDKSVNAVDHFKLLQVCKGLTDLIQELCRINADHTEQS